MVGISRKKVSDLKGKTFGRLTVVEYLGVGKHDKHYWVCECKCGGKVVLPTYRITGKTVATKSCGCLRKEHLLSVRHDPTTHNLHATKLYAIFHAMKHRCTNPNAQRYQYYGAKGIRVTWDNVEDFVAWALSAGYKDGLSIDRVDNDKDYEPSNCRWITVAENTRHAHLGRPKKLTRRSARRIVQEDQLCKEEVESH